MKVLVYRLGSLGDTVVALPALRLVQRAYPRANRIMLTEFSVSGKARAVAAILDATGLIDGYIEYPMKLRSVAGLVALRRAIRAARPDVLVYLAEPRGFARAVRDAPFFHACGIHTQIGVLYAGSQQGTQKLATGLYESRAARLLRCIGKLGPASVDEPGAFEMCLTPAELAEAAEKLASVRGAPLLVASIGAKVDVKDWGDENWRALLPRLAEQLPGRAVTMIGAPVERERSAALAALWPSPSLNLCGELSVRGHFQVLQPLGRMVSPRPRSQGALPRHRVQGPSPPRML